MMSEHNKAVLEALLIDLRGQLVAVDKNPMLPGAVKLAVNTTFQILDILVSEVSHGQA